MRSGRDRRSLEGQVALVTGGGRGIGHAISLELSGAGARVLVTGRSERELGEIVGEIVHAGGQARHLAGDVRDPLHAPAAVARAIDTWGRLDLVVANAGIPGNVAMGPSGPRTSSTRTSSAPTSSSTRLSRSYGVPGASSRSAEFSANSASAGRRR